MISVVIPLYNKIDYVEECIKSVLSQEFLPVEILVVDDGSDDGSLQKVKSIHSDLIRIIPTDSPQSGPSIARNMGVQNANSDWIAFLDADDLWEKSYLKAIAQILTDNSDKISYIFSPWLLKSSNDIKKSFVVKDAGADPFFDFERFLQTWIDEKQCPMWTSATVVKKQDFINCGGFPVKYRRAEDKIAWLRIAKDGIGYYNPLPLAIYNIDVPGQLTKAASPVLHPVVSEISGIVGDNYPHQTQIRKLKNNEIMRSVKDLKMQHKCTYDMRSKFYIPYNPLSFIFMIFCTYCPTIVQQNIYNFANSGLRFIGRKA
ncbi:MAG: glycosyltransferase family A protein [Sphingobium sp.]